MSIRKIGIVGYGSLGKYLVECIHKDQDLDISFVYNRDAQKLNEIEPKKRLETLEEFTKFDADLIVEVAHPEISHKYATKFLQHADYMPGSPTAFANKNFEHSVLDLVTKDHSHAMYVPRGAMWYLDCILQMAKAKKLCSMNITMKKHPLSIHYYGPLEKSLADIKQQTVIYSGNVRKVCEYAPNNVNTMAVAALASGLGMDQVHAELVVDPTLESHIIEVELYGSGEGEDRYSEKAQRFNPAKKGAVTGSATYASFFRSMKCAHGNRNGMHFC